MSQHCLLLVNFSADDWCFPVTSQVQIIGTGPDAQIQVPPGFKTVGSKQAEIWGDRHGTWLKHSLGVASGTSVNGLWIDKLYSVRVITGDRIWLGGASALLKDASSPMRAYSSHCNFLTPINLDAVQWDRSLRDQALCLTRAETDVVLCTSRGTFKEVSIGKLLHRSEGTVHTELSHIYRKLEIHSMSELLVWLGKCSLHTG